LYKKETLHEKENKLPNSIVMPKIVFMHNRKKINKKEGMNTEGREEGNCYFTSSQR